MGETMKGHISPLEFRAAYQGETRFVRTSSHLTLTDGKVTGLNGIMTDITKRKEAEIALKSKTALLEAQLETTVDGILVIDKDKRIGLTNKRLIELFDVPPQLHDEKDSHRFISHIVSQALYPERLYEKVKQIFINSLQTINDELECVNGKTLDWYSTPIMDKDGTSYGRIWVFHDITDRKKAQDQLLKSEIRYRSLFQNSPSGILILDQNGTILEANEAFSQITFYTNDELIGADVRMLITPGNEYMVEQNIRLILSGEVLEQEVLSLRKDGTSCTLLLREIAILLPNGSKGVLSVSNDISERKKAEKDLALKNVELSDTVAEKDKFFSIISHDLRSPFNGFLGLTQMMADDLPNMTLDEIQNVAISMRQSATNLYRLLENLLEWSRMEQGIIPFSPTNIKLNEIVNQGLQTIMELANNKNISVSLNIPDEIWVFADSNIFETVIRNLASNAVKFTPNGGQVIISAKTVGQQNIEVSVKDSGIGMSSEILSKLFMITGNISRRGTNNEPSTGLGLFLCKGFIEKHGGRIWAESEEGKGTVFHFSIPFAETGS
jgi:PAS domain S-box-containing protein